MTKLPIAGLHAHLIGLALRLIVSLRVRVAFPIATAQLCPPIGHLLLPIQGIIDWRLHIMSMAVHVTRLCHQLIVKVESGACTWAVALVNGLREARSKK